MATVLVTGATGTLGHEVLARLAARQYHIRVLVHRSVLSIPTQVEVIRGDFVSGKGLRDAIDGVHTIIHCASAYQDAQQVDIEGTQLLLQEARASGASHLIYPSIVGVDQSSYAYYRAKQKAEKLIEQGPLPWTIVRITQFHDYILWLMQTFGVDTKPVVTIPQGMRFQPIDVGEVADRLVSLVEQVPYWHTMCMGGPQVCTFEEMTETYLRLLGKKVSIRSEAAVEGLYNAFTSGINLVPEHAAGTISWEEFLRDRYSKE